MTMTPTQTARPVGIRFLLPLIPMIPLFFAVFLGIFAYLYPQQVDAAVRQQSDAAPLANPALTVVSDTDLAPEVLSALSAVSAPIPAVSYDTVTADNTAVRLIALDSEHLGQAFVLTDGRMPQNERECVVTVLDAAADFDIGAAIRPCKETGTALTDPQTDTPCTLNVVGIAENLSSVLAPMTDDTVSAVVYTLSSEAWYNDGVTHLWYLTDGERDAVQSVLDQTADVQKAYLAAATAAELQSYVLAAETANNAALAQEIALQTVDNRLDTANVRVTELENSMMDAVAALQAEQQQFVSDMEYNEYYALRQVDLIPRRDRAEEGYAKQEAVIDELRAQLLNAYAERDAVAAEAAAAKATLAVLQTEAEHAQARLDAVKSAPSVGSTVTVLTAKDHPAQRLLSDHTQTASADTRLPAILCAVAFVLACVLDRLLIRTRDTAVVPSVLLTAGIAAAAAWLGGWILPRTVFADRFPALTEVLPLDSHTADAWIAAALFVLAAAVITALIAVLLPRIRHRA